MIIFLIVFFGGLGYVFYLDAKNSKAPSNEISKPTKNNSKKSADTSKDKINVLHSQDIIDFKEIVVLNEEHAIINLNDSKYIGICEIGGINFNLLSENERVSLEEGFAQLLNGIDFPVQLFVQSRKIDMDNYKVRYEKRLFEMEKEITLLKEQLTTATNNKKDLTDKLSKKTNGYNYTKQLIDYFLSRTVNSDLLERKYYFVFRHSHNTSAFENSLSTEEIVENAYNDIFNKSIVVLDSLGRHNLHGRLLDCFELGELLYSCYNKEDSSMLKFRNAVKARYNHLFTTAKPVHIKALELQKKELEECLEEANSEFTDRTKQLVEAEMLLNDTSNPIKEGE